MQFHANFMLTQFVPIWLLWPTTDANIRRHLAAIFGTYKRMKSDINVPTIYINVKAGDHGIKVYCLGKSGEQVHQGL